MYGAFAALMGAIFFVSIGQAQENVGAFTPETVPLELDPREYSPAEIQLLQELEVRRAELERREQAIDLREKLVDLAEQRLLKRVDELANLQTEMEVLLQNLSSKEEEELKQLASIYSDMKPAAAGEVLNRLDNAIVFDLFKRIQSKKVAKIMEKMSPAKVRFISQMLAEKADLPKLESTP
jgi:flagellar motility protein MotE (MotC chaperone)